MKVILLQDVAKVGKRYEVVEVPNGFATNKLFPKLLAEAASPSNMKKINRRQAGMVANQEAGKARFETAIELLRAKALQFATEVNEKGHLFKAVHEADIAAVAQSMSINIEASMITIATPIKEVGEHTVTLKEGSHKAEFTVEVIKK